MHISIFNNWNKRLITQAKTNCLTKLSAEKEETKTFWSLIDLGEPNGDKTTP
jgi:hypothetical protein